MKTEQLYKFVPIEDAKKTIELYQSYLCKTTGGAFIELAYRQKSATGMPNGYWTDEEGESYDPELILLPFHPSPKEISEEEGIIFIIDGKEESQVYSPMDLLGKYEETILEDMEPDCSCNPNESRNYCECEPQYENSKITGYRLSLPCSGSKTEEIKECKSCGREIHRQHYCNICDNDD